MATGRKLILPLLWLGFAAELRLIAWLLMDPLLDGPCTPSIEELYGLRMDTLAI